VIAGRVVGDAEADAVATEAEAWIDAHLGPEYPWPGNVRELEQCVRNLVIRGHYRPRRAMPAADPRVALWERVATGALDGHAVLRRDCTLVYAETGSYSETARRVGVDRKTARLKVDPAWLAALRGTGAVPLDGHGTTASSMNDGEGPTAPRRRSPRAPRRAMTVAVIVTPAADPSRTGLTCTVTSSRLCHRGTRTAQDEAAWRPGC
jgi:hypothetical protein